TDADLEGAREAYRRALEIAQSRGDESMIAAANRELGVIATGRVRIWFVERVRSGEHLDVMKSLVGGATLQEMLPDLPIADDVNEALGRFQEALQIYEKLGDRKGIMST